MLRKPVSAQMQRLLESLAAIGFDYESPLALAQSGRRYEAAVSILIQGLSECDKKWDKEMIVRALSVPWAKPEAIRPLLDAFRTIGHRDGEYGRVGWAIGNALDVLYDDKFYDDYIRLVRDRSFDDNRQMMVLALRKSKRPEVVDELIALCDDESVNGHAVDALVKFKDERARSVFDTMLHDKRAWVRRSAARGLKRLDTSTR